ncbi:MULTISPECIES: Sec-independent protein translocase subunit TatA [Actinokineospora]|uniref:Sec-independent protein translocase protein TatA n=1 Tax=Actinokineospora fastidiosa TaxID=1816 RepID=A0A918GRV7_9PSEU|nr:MULTISPECIES: Sec-independent protein translocase subunit TatA [Actinokineospora]UVS79042.1 Sec-independent protein translocase protein TatAy [Actinokineospora sp. UTMC 2448]GGS56118.1 sec-independent protein translocase protein TatA [Actinokineospora fastidiosa]
MNFGPWEILIIAVVIVLLFGARKMPQMARSLGQSMRILKAETKGMRKDEDDDAPAKAEAPAPQQLAAAKPEKTPEQLQKEIDELQRKVDQQQKNAS